MTHAWLEVSSPLRHYCLIMLGLSNFKNLFSNIEAFWICKKIEKSRFESIGEMSALIAHDLGNPLNTILFCAEALKEGVPEDKKAHYHQQLEMNLNRAISLVRSIRNKVKNETGSKTTNLLEAHTNVMNVLETQFRDHKDAFKKIEFDFAENLRTVELQISLDDMIHIFDNLYRNSVKNFIDAKINSPRITIRQGKANESSLEILITDNGTGLSKEAFDNFTEITFSNFKKNCGQSGLGLKLIKRLIDFNNGKLDVVENKGQTGTTFSLTLLKPTQERNFK